MIDPFVNARWLRAHPEAVVVDSRWTPDGGPAAAAYRDGHIPGAVFADLDADLAAPAGPGGRHPLPAPEAFAAALGRLGAGPRDAVVAYDAHGGVFAARLVWMLRALGQDAAVLDGGLAAWDGPLEAGDVARPPADVPARPWPAALLADADAAASGGSVTLDGRTAGRFAGEPSPLDPRPGHIPGARSAPVGGNLAPDGTMLPPHALAARFRALGAGDAGRVVAYCGSGVTACHNLLAMEHAGLGRGRLYAGSWSQYAADPSRPVATGPN